jgi:transcriptional regulator with XRE-family HTH domain
VAGRKKKDETEPKPSIDLDRSIGPNLKRWREIRGFSQEELAQRAEVHRTEIGLLERGGREPKAGIVTKLAGALGISQGALFEGFAFVPSESGQGHFSYRLPELETQSPAASES